MVCCLPTCAKGSSFHVAGFLGYDCFWAFLFLPCVVHSWGVLVVPVTFCGVQGLGLVGVPFFGFALWAFSDLGITCLTSGKMMGQLIIQVFFFMFGFRFWILYIL